MNPQDRPTVIKHTSDISNVPPSRRRRSTSFILPDNIRVDRVIFNSNYLDYSITNDNQHEISIPNFLNNCRSKLESILGYELDLKKGLKVNILLSVVYINIIDVTLDFVYQTLSAPLLHVEEIDEYLENSFEKLLGRSRES